MIFVFLLVTRVLAGQTIQDISDTSVHASFRGLSVVDDNVVWVSGTKGNVGHSEDGGLHWKWNAVPGCELLDFRSLYAFDAKKAIVASAGTPAVIFLTADGGKNWQEIFRSTDTLMFFDGMDFWDELHGIIFGDPVNGKLFLMETLDGGLTWNEMKESERPVLEKGEAAFAASGTTIRTEGESEVWIATGGTRSRLWHSADYGHSWTDLATPIIQGLPSTGIFSFALAKKNTVLIIGGNYSQQNIFDLDPETTKVTSSEGMSVHVTGSAQCAIGLNGIVGS